MLKTMWRSINTDFFICTIYGKKCVLTVIE